MTLPYSPSRAVYEGNGVTTAFPFAFKVWSADQLNVSVTSPQGDISSAQGWSASIGENGGTLTYLHEGYPLPDGWRIAIVRDMPFAQGIDLVSASRFDPQVIEDGLDQATAELQQLNEKISRAVILPATSKTSPEEVVASIYTSRDAAAQSATSAAFSASAAAASATLAAQNVTSATQSCLEAATEQANAAASSAQNAQQAADTAVQAAQDAMPENILDRITQAETDNTQQNARLDDAESSITAISSTLIGSIITVLATNDYVPNGCVPADGAEYSREQFQTFYDLYLTGDAKLLTCTYANFAAQVALTGNCANFAVDADNQAFKVPLLKDGDSITQASSVAAIGKSVKAGLPDATGILAVYAPSAPHGGIFTTGSSQSVLSGGTLMSGPALNTKLSSSNPIYGNSNTVTDEQIRLRHFVVIASAQNNASVFDWSNYMVALAGKLNTDFSNKPSNIAYVIESWRSGYNWYRKWSDGYIEQGGRIADQGSTVYTITFNTAFAETNYDASIEFLTQATGTYNDYVGWAKTINRTVSSFQCTGKTSSSNNAAIQWRARGY